MSERSGDAILRHYLAGLVFRFRHVTDESGEEFARFDAGNGVRTPGELVRHMTGLVHFALEQFEVDQSGVDQSDVDQSEADHSGVHQPEVESAVSVALSNSAERNGQLRPLPWEDERTRFVDAVWALHELVRLGVRLRPGRKIPTIEQVWYGPLSDLMTHVGQLATLRRLAGDPVAGVRYWQITPRLAAPTPRRKR